jgi:hypothetical protein
VVACLPGDQIAGVLQRHGARNWQEIYVANFGTLDASSIPQFARELFTTGVGWRFIIEGNAAGLLFAALALTISFVSFPLLLDYNVAVAVAVLTSIRVVFEIRYLRRRGGPSLQPLWWPVPYPSSLVSQSSCQCWGIRAGMSIAGRWGTSRYGPRSLQPTFENGTFMNSSAFMEIEYE